MSQEEITDDLRSLKALAGDEACVAGVVNRKRANQLEPCGVPAGGIREGARGSGNMNPWEYSIIVVEDEPDEAVVLKQVFHSAGLKNPIQVFHDGQEVVDYLSQQETDAGKALSDAPPVLMLLDLKVPGKSGFEVLEWLRAQPGLKRLIVVVMTTSSDISDINRAYQLGCNSCLHKPGNVEQWVEMVKRINSYWLLLNEKPDVRYRSNAFRAC